MCANKEQFKKPKKVRKVLRKGKNKMMKADDLIPLPAVDIPAPKSKRPKQEDEGWIKTLVSTKSTLLNLKCFNLV